ncbi:UNVERIFIED_CONTAM: hypothetical protein Sradi_0865400 [Sesamum radiatum]|uniref:Retrovirus-related Pol polyprotein from transposon TNT 1-94-like beta-barrel domain-containing protein n=1 Tax=Sesamum radiatum TaxID=300843 RepID=A0AAW2V1W2_SESRA
MQKLSTKENLKELLERNHLKIRGIITVIIVRKLGTPRDTCFKLHGTPDWYKELTEQRRKQPTIRGFMVDSTEMKIAGGQPEITDHSLLQGLMKLLLGSIQQEEQINFAQTDDFVGEQYAFVSHEQSAIDFWIVDTGATNHMCANPQLLHDILPLSYPIFIHPPNGSKQQVTHSGNLCLHENLTLTNVFLVPTFKHNLL